MTIITRMGSLIYVHHPGQRLNPDSTSKLQIEVGQTWYTELLFDLTYTLPTFLKSSGTLQKCSDQYNRDLDNCIIDVSRKFDRLQCIGKTFLFIKLRPWTKI